MIAIGNVNNYSRDSKMLPSHSDLGLPEKITDDDPRRKFRKLMRSLAEKRGEGYNISKLTKAYLFPTFQVFVQDDGQVKIQELSEELKADELRGTKENRKVKVDRPDKKRKKTIQIVSITPTISLDEYRNSMKEVLLTEHGLSEQSDPLHQNSYWYCYSLNQTYLLNSGDVDLSITNLLDKTYKLFDQDTITHFVFLPGDLIGFGPTKGTTTVKASTRG